MRSLGILIAVLVLSLAGSAQAGVKFYDASKANGTPADGFLNSTGLCPPAVTTLGDTFGFMELSDDGLGTVTLEKFSSETDIIADLGPQQLQGAFGPGAFVFIINQSTTSTTAPGLSNVSGIGAHGPSSTASGSSAEWGIVSGFQITGLTFCIGSPVTICFNAGFVHGVTIDRTLPSTTYDLGTWNFDAEGDYEAVSGYIVRTSNGGLTNNGARLRGALQGTSLPALPLVGFGALALSLAVIGGRALLGKK
jgi:hypothetical protein